MSTGTNAIVICLRPVPISAVIGVISTWKKSSASCFRPICRLPVSAAAIIVSKSTPFTSSPAWFITITSKLALCAALGIPGSANIARIASNAWASGICS